MALTSPPRPAGRLARLINLIETMTAPHPVDTYLELVDPMLSLTDLRAEITAVDRLTEDTVTLELRPSARWTGFRAGQFVQVGVVVDGIRHTRCFSPANSEHRRDGRIELTIKAHGGGVVSRHLRENAALGQIMSIAPATGTFVLPQPRPDDVVLISGGSGITPVMSMLRTLVDEEHTGRIAFLHYAFTEKDVAYGAELAGIAARFNNIDVRVVATGDTSAATAPGDLRGHFTAGHLDAVSPWVSGAQTFLCGPPSLMAAVRAEFDRRGVADALHSEEFGLPTTAADTEDATGSVTFSTSETTVDNSGATLLEQAEAAGLAPQFGCRMGICHTCTATKKIGRTRNVLTGEVDDQPDTAIQPCVSVAVGDVDLEL